MVDKMFSFKIHILDMDSLSSIWASRWLQMKWKQFELQSYLNEIDNFHIKFVSIQVIWKSYDYLKMYRSLQCPLAGRSAYRCGKGWQVNSIAVSNGGTV
jgi:hypothetical protein